MILHRRFQYAVHSCSSRKIVSAHAGTESTHFTGRNRVMPLPLVSHPVVLAPCINNDVRGLASAFNDNWGLSRRLSSSTPDVKSPVRETGADRIWTWNLSAPCECSSIQAGPLHQCLFNCQIWRETSPCLIASFDNMMPCHTAAKDVWICFIKEDIICKYRQASLCMSCDRLQQGTATSLFNSLTVQQLNKGASCLFFPPWGTFGEYIYHCDILTP